MPPQNLPDGNTQNANGIKVDRRFLKLHPDPCGAQHDATEPGYFGGRVKWWTKALREIDPNAILHPISVRQVCRGKRSNISTPYNRIGLKIFQITKSSNQYYPQER